MGGSRFGCFSSAGFGFAKCAWKGKFADSPGVGQQFRIGDRVCGFGEGGRRGVKEGAAGVGEECQRVADLEVEGGRSVPQ